MQIAVLLSAILILLTHIIIKRRPKFRGFWCLRAGGKIKDKIVRIERLSIGFISQRLLNEIKIFNRMRLVMPCRRGVPVLYSQFLGRLIIDPSFVVRNSDGIARLLYICAAANYFNHSKDGLVRRQLMKNCLYAFGQRDIVKRVIRIMRPTFRGISVYRHTRFKYLGRQFVFAKKRQDRLSYTIYDGKKHCADKVLPVQCFEFTGERFSYRLAPDKFKYNLTHTSDTFYAVTEGKALGLYVPDKVSFGSSLCESGDELRVYATSKGDKFYIITAKTKQEVTSIVGLLKKRRGKIDYLLTTDEAKEVSQIESLFERAWASRFVKGDDLKKKFTSASKYVPTLFLPTLVYQIEQPDDFFEVVDNFKYFRRIASTGNNLNIVFLYSSMSGSASDAIRSYANHGEAQELINAGVFLFFIDRITADKKAVNYLSLVFEGRARVAMSRSTRNNVEVNTHIGTSSPITHTIYVRNTQKQRQATTVNIPIDVGSELEGLPFGMPSVCRRVGASLRVTNLKSGRSSMYKLPMGSTVTDEFGRTISECEIMCETVLVRCNIRLAKFEEKIFKIIKNSKWGKKLVNDEKMA
jgi:hypothetical protein